MKFHTQGDMVSHQHVEQNRVKTPLDRDETLLERVRRGIPWAYRSWEPERMGIVLGRGNTQEREVYEERCEHDHIPIFRRRGGGGTVVLYPGILVISVFKRVAHPYHFKNYFHHINGDIIESLESLEIAGLSHQGHSDICIGNRKILGSSMYRSKEILFYTASLMVSNDLEVIDRYVRHPPKEPDYRQGRNHRDFLTTIIRVYPSLTFKMVKNAVDTLLPKRIPEIV